MPKSPGMFVIKELKHNLMRSKLKYSVKILFEFFCKQQSFPLAMVGEKSFFQLIESKGCCGDLVTPKMPLFGGFFLYFTIFLTVCRSNITVCYGPSCSIIALTLWASCSN
ncbi:hypothetical protein GOODEAATRI_004982 [Goodea atripinnis]|uniref:Uncharacterized protein n=1 Tax=Goodea atripinnis TaxID=208336 RepID=A0ABV0N823_9TELE